MGIASVDSLIAGFKTAKFFIKAATGTMVVGRPISTWGLAGIPGAGAYDNTLNGVVLSSSAALVDGQIPFYDPAGGQSTYLARLAAASVTSGKLILCDRLWHNGNINNASTSVQNITSPAFPARDDDGTINGKGVILGLEVSGTLGATTPTITVGYTNSDNTSGRSGTNIIATAASSAVRTFYPIGLQARDKGVKSVQSIQASANIGGTSNLVAYRPIAELPLPNAMMGETRDALEIGLPRLFDGTVPFLLFYPAGTATATIHGSIVYAQG